MNDTEASYRREWATLTGKSESEIYVPEAIREPEQPSLDVLRALLSAKIDE